MFHDLAADISLYPERAKVGAPEGSYVNEHGQDRKCQCHPPVMGDPGCIFKVGCSFENLVDNTPDVKEGH